jgi:inhibitor of cysteine peptidase
VVLSEGDRGRTIAVDKGSTVTVRLRENPTTGYRWAVESMEGLDLLRDRAEPGTGVGAAGARVLEFRATRAGSNRLRLKHWRDWEGESSVTDRYELSINVK